MILFFVDLAYFKYIVQKHKGRNIFGGISTRLNNFGSTSKERQANRKVVGLTASRSQSEFDSESDRERVKVVVHLYADGWPLHERKNTPVHA